MISENIKRIQNESLEFCWKLLRQNLPSFTEKHPWPECVGRVHNIPNLQSLRNIFNLQKVGESFSSML